MNDWRGTEIEVGSTIIYGVTQSSSITMVEAVVDEITSQLNHGYRWRCNDRVPVLWVKRMDETGSMWGPVGKRVKITRIDRITVVQPRGNDDGICLECSYGIGH